MTSPLDLSTWQEFHGLTSLDAVICPHCEHRHDIGPPPCTRPPLALESSCPRCHRTFTLRTMQTPLGLAWQTWDRDPQKP